MHPLWLEHEFAENQGEICVTVDALKGPRHMHFFQVSASRDDHI